MKTLCTFVFVMFSLVLSSRLARAQEYGHLDDWVCSGTGVSGCSNSSSGSFSGSWAMATNGMCDTDDGDTYPGYEAGITISSGFCTGSLTQSGGPGEEHDYIDGFGYAEEDSVSAGVYMSGSGGYIFSEGSEDCAYNDFDEDGTPFDAPC